MFQKIKKTLGNPRKDPRAKRYRRENLAKIQPRDLEIERTSIHRGVRVLFYKQGCQFCKEWKRVIPYINSRLARSSKTIDMVDVKSHDPKVDYLQPEAAPELYIDGFVIRGITIQEFGIGFLEEWLKDELVV